MTVVYPNMCYGYYECIIKGLHCTLFSLFELDFGTCEIYGSQFLLMVKQILFLLIEGIT